MWRAGEQGGVAVERQGVEEESVAAEERGLPVGIAGKGGSGNQPTAQLRRACLVASCIILSSAGAAAQGGAAPDPEIAKRLIACLDLAEERPRLQCYDSLVRQLAASAGNPQDQQPTAIYSLAGRDDHDSEALTIKQPWRLRWTFEGSILAIELRSQDNELVDIIGHQIGEGEGESEPLEPGVYRLAMRGIGSWSVSVEPR
jgi:hypothetical protein